MSAKLHSEGHFLKLPEHVAIVMDGNGRWAEKRGLSRHIGHEQGAKTTQHVVQYLSELGIKYVTLYAFSSENWQRPRDEVDAVMQILDDYLKNDVDELVKNDIKIAAIGDLSSLPGSVQKSLAQVVLKTQHGKKLTITLALSYGAWGEVVDACQAISKECLEQTILVSSINKEVLRNNLYTNDLPDPDLLIRCGGEVRLSNFLLLQLSYTELYFCNTLWPDFGRSDVDRALKSYQGRQRRFGEISPDQL